VALGLLLASLVASDAVRTGASESRAGRRSRSKQASTGVGWATPITVLLSASEGSEELTLLSCRSVTSNIRTANVTVVSSEKSVLDAVQNDSRCKGALVIEAPARSGGSGHTRSGGGRWTQVLHAALELLQGGRDVLYVEPGVVLGGDVLAALAMVAPPQDVLVPIHPHERVDGALMPSVFLARATPAGVAAVQAWEATLGRKRGQHASSTSAAGLALGYVLEGFRMLPDKEACPGKAQTIIIRGAEVSVRAPRSLRAAGGRGEGGRRSDPVPEASATNVSVGVLPASTFTWVCGSKGPAPECSPRDYRRVLAAMCPGEDSASEVAKVATMIAPQARAGNAEGAGEKVAAAATPAAEATAATPTGGPSSGELEAAAKVAAAEAERIANIFAPEDREDVLGSLVHYNEDYIIDKIGRALTGADGAKRFVVSVHGTSVTAGHDNLFEESYPIVFGKELQTAFAAAGVELVVRNMAMGNNPVVPSAFCVASQLGLDTDVAVWEFGMMVEGPQKMPMTEQWIRQAAMMPKRPAIMLVDPGEGARKEHENPSVPRTGRPHPYDFCCAGNPGRRLVEYYKAFGMHTQAMYQAVWARDHRPEPNPYSYKHLVTDDKKAQRKAPWHAGPHGHALRARILAHGYLVMLGKAITRAVAAVKGGRGAASVFPEPAPAVLPKPLACDPELCSMPQRCLMTYEPRADGGANLMDAVEEPFDLKRMEGTKHYPNNAWHVQLFETDFEALDAVFKEKLGYLDLKYVLQGNDQAGPISFKFSSTRAGRVFICQPPGLWGKLPDNVRSLDTHADAYLDGNKMEWEDPGYYTERNLDKITCKAFKGTVQAGNHNLALTARTKAVEAYVAISAIVYPHD